MRTNFILRDGRIVESETDSAPIIHFSNPEKDEREWLATDCGISEHTISSALDPDELGRLEVEDDHISLIIKIPKNYCSEDNFLFKVMSMGIFLFDERIIIVSTRDEAPFFEIPYQRTCKDMADVLVRVLAGTIGHFLGHLKVINMLSDALEEKINTSMANEHLLSMFTIEKSLVYYLNGIHSNGVVIEKLKLNAKRLRLREEQLELLDDLIIDNSQCNKQAEIYSDILTGLMDARGSIVNNNLGLLMKRLTIVSIVFMPLNVLAGIGGMSEFSVMTEGIPKFFSYSAFTIGLVFVAFVTYFIVKHFSGDSTVEKVEKPARWRLFRKR